jgi:hypothetical protein
MDDSLAKSVDRILKYLSSDGSYELPHRYYCSEDGSIPIKVMMWKSELTPNPCQFGITISTRGDVTHSIMNIRTTSLVTITPEFVKDQLKRVNRILKRSLEPICGKLGTNEVNMMNAAGMDKATYGIEACCVCGKETAIKTKACSHPLCIACFVKVSRCPLCRSCDVRCACCESEDEDNESDDEFEAV